MLRYGSYILDCVDYGGSLGIAGRVKAVKWSTTEAAVELGAERCDKTRTVLR